MIDSALIITLSCFLAFFDLEFLSLFQFYPKGGARAIVDVLFGEYNPAGRTAVTW